MDSYDVYGLIPNKIKFGKFHDFGPVSASQAVGVQQPP